MAEQVDGEDLEFNDIADDPAGDDQDQAQDQEDGDEPEDDLEVLFDDEAAPASTGQDSGLVRDLRARLREKDEEVKRLRTTSQPKPIEVGEKPTLEGCEYDEAKFETELDAWKERKAGAEQAQAAARNEQEAQAAAWADEVKAYEGKKAALGVRDFAPIEDEVFAHLSPVQRIVIVKAADDAAKVTFALNRAPDRLKALSAITDPIKFAVAVAKLEGTIKVTNQRKPPAPESRVRGSAPLSVGKDKTEERLEREAKNSGDRTALIKYRKEKSAKAK